MPLRARGRPATSPMRSFDPRAVGALETRAWETYYRRRWGACLVAFVDALRDLYADAYGAAPAGVIAAAALLAVVHH